MGDSDGAPPVTMVVLEVIRARNLLAKDSNGFSDPYAVIRMGNQKVKTRIIKKNLDPVWDEEFVLSVSRVESETIEISLWDWDFGPGNDDFLGQLTIPLVDVLHGGDIFEKWNVLQKRTQKSSVGGELQISVRLPEGSAWRRFVRLNKGAS